MVITFCFHNFLIGRMWADVQGGSDKSGILKIFSENNRAQLKIIRFYKSKKKLAEGHIENELIQWNDCHRWRQSPSWTWTCSRPSPRCPCPWTPPAPSSSGSGPRIFCETLHWPIIQSGPRQNNPKGCSQASWEAPPLLRHLREVLLMDLPWSLVISSSGLGPRLVNMQSLRLLCVFLFFLGINTFSRNEKFTYFPFIMSWTMLLLMSLCS